MDKLDDLFRGFRSGVTAPSEDAVSAARELLRREGSDPSIIRAHRDPGDGGRSSLLLLPSWSAGFS